MNKIKIEYESRIRAGKKYLPESIWQQWENFVTISYEQAYEIENIDLVLKFLMELNKDTSIRQIATYFKDEMQTKDNFTIIEILDYIARLHDRGIDLLEVVSKDMQIEIDNSYIENIRKTKQLIEMGEDIEDATTIALHQHARLTINNQVYIVLIDEENSISGVTKDGHLILGDYFDEASIIYFIEGTRYYAFMTLNGKTILVDNTSPQALNIGDLVNISKYKTGVGYILADYNKIFDHFQKLPIETIIDVLREKRDLCPDGMKNTFKSNLNALMSKYEENIVKLEKSAE